MTLTKRVIPCLDVRDGRVVKGLQFGSMRDAGDPVELAARYSSEGADELVFLDITASEERRRAIAGMVRDVARVIDIPFTVGGGVNSVDDARNILLNGADKVGVNTGAVGDPGLVGRLAELFGRQCVVVAIDAKRNYDVGRGGSVFREGGRGFWYEVFTYGGKRGTGIDAMGWARRAEALGAGEILLTSIDRDGTKDGYDTLLTGEAAASVSVPVVASGGCGSPDDMADVLSRANADAALAASIFHYEARGVNGVKRRLRELGVPVRL